MPELRKPVVCNNHDGSEFRVTYAEAEELVREDLAERVSEKRIRMKRECRAGGRLSLRVGKTLAMGVQRDEPWARAMLLDSRPR